MRLYETKKVLAYGHHGHTNTTQTKNMNTIRSGKIARLPDEVREQVNRRLANHESSTPLLAWLNALPEVRAMLAQEFGGKAVGPHNLYEWRHGGHAEWRRQQEAREIMRNLHAEGNELTKLAEGSVLNITTQWLAANYAVAMKRTEGQRGGDPKAAWERMRAYCHDLVALQRGECRARRLEIDQAAQAATHAVGASWGKLQASTSKRQ